MREYFLKTNRIGFSKWNLEDTNLANYLWSNESVVKFINANGKFSNEEIINRLKNEISNQDKFSVQYWPIFQIENNEFIGCCGLRPYRKENNIYEIGFHLHSNYWGKGFGTEAAKAVINYAFEVLGVENLFAGHHPDNNKSAIMLKKLGFHYTHSELYEPTGLRHPSYLYK